MNTVDIITAFCINVIVFSVSWLIIKKDGDSLIGQSLTLMQQSVYSGVMEKGYSPCQKGLVP